MSVRLPEPVWGTVQNERVEPVDDGNEREKRDRGRPAKQPITQQRRIYGISMCAGDGCAHHNLKPYEATVSVARASVMKYIDCLTRY